MKSFVSEWNKLSIALRKEKFNKKKFKNTLKEGMQKRRVLMDKKIEGFIKLFY